MGGTPQSDVVDVLYHAGRASLALDYKDMSA